MRCSAQQEKHRCMATTHGCCAIGITGYTGYCQSHKWRMKPKRKNLAFSIVSSLCSLLRILLAGNISCLSIKFRKIFRKKQIAKLFVIVESKTFHSVSATADISSFESVENVHDFQNFPKTENAYDTFGIYRINVNYDIDKSKTDYSFTSQPALVQSQI